MTFGSLKPGMKFVRADPAFNARYAYLKLECPVTAQIDTTQGTYTAVELDTGCLYYFSSDLEVIKVLW